MSCLEGRRCLGRLWPLLLLSVATFVLLVVVLTYGMGLHSPDLSGFGDRRNVHAVLMTGGVLLCLNGALLPSRLWHGVVQSVAAAALVAGGAVVYTSIPDSHLFSSHELLGFVVLVVLALHWLSALAALLLFPRSAEAAAWWPRQHRLGGLFVVLGGVAAATSGLTTYQQALDRSTFPYVSHAFRYGFVYVGMNVVVLLLVLLGVFVVFALRQGDGAASEDAARLLN